MHGERAYTVYGPEGARGNSRALGWSTEVELIPERTASGCAVMTAVPAADCPMAPAKGGSTSFCLFSKSTGSLCMAWRPPRRRYRYNAPLVLSTPQMSPLVLAAVAAASCGADTPPPCESTNPQCAE
jgi:hypothetical protein